MLAIVDYGCGNFASIRNMLKRIGVMDILITRDIQLIAAADRIILPGVGSYDTGMRNIRQFGLEEILHHKALEEKVPVLGICLGMQLLLSGSEEGQEEGLGWIKGRVVRFRPEDCAGLKIPHMGWNSVQPAGFLPLFGTQPDEFGFYFIHSYAATCDNEADVAGWTRHGISFVSAVAKGNIWGAQFHPEKSHKYGMQFFRNFMGMETDA